MRSAACRDTPSPTPSETRRWTSLRTLSSTSGQTNQQPMLWPCILDWSRTLTNHLCVCARDVHTRDDAEVVTEFAFPALKEIVEPWNWPGMNTINHTHKTGVAIGGNRLMIGCFTPFDDVHMGVTVMRNRQLT